MSKFAYISITENILENAGINAKTDPPRGSRLNPIFSRAYRIEIRVKKSQRVNKIGNNILEVSVAHYPFYFPTLEQHFEDRISPLINVEHWERRGHVGCVLLGLCLWLGFDLGSRLLWGSCLGFRSLAGRRLNVASWPCGASGRRVRLNVRRWVLDIGALICMPWPRGFYNG